MSNIVTWRSYSKGKCIPTDALQLGSYRKDGQLYVGRRGEKGEVGKINAHGSNMKDLWTHDQGKTSNGDILCGTSGSVKWTPLKQGDLIPVDAIKAGYYHKDGDLYIGRAETGEIGKINTSANKMRNLWSHDGGRRSAGEILCAVPMVVKLIYRCIPIFETDGCSSGFFDKQVKMESGLSGSSKEVVNVNEISTKASLKWDTVAASATMDTSTKTHIKEACLARYQSKTEDTTIHVDYSKPCYVYQAAVVAKMSNGTEIRMKHGAFIQRSKPIQDTEYQFDI